MEYKIKTILKEDDDFNMKNILKGLDALLSIIKGEYPFIVGYFLPKNFNDYTYNFYIGLTISADKVKEYYNYPFDVNYKYYLDDPSERTFPLAYSILDYPEGDNRYREHFKMEGYISEMYEMIPDDYKPTSTDTRGNKILKTLRADSFNFVK